MQPPVTREYFHNVGVLTHALALYESECQGSLAQADGAL